MTDIIAHLTARKRALEIQAAEVEGGLREIYAVLALMADDQPDDSGGEPGDAAPRQVGAGAAKITSEIQARAARIAPRAVRRTFKMQEDGP